MARKTTILFLSLLCAAIPGGLSHAQVYNSPTYYSPTYYSSPTHSSCLSFSYNLHEGSTDYTTGGEVTELQQFLSQKGYFLYAPTGYFGAITYQSVQEFQAAEVLPSTGYVGPLTRSLIEQISCGSGQAYSPPTQQYLSLQALSPEYGYPGTNVTIYGTGFTSNNTIYFDSTVVGQVYSYGNSLTFTVPSISAGIYNIVVQNVDGTSNSLYFTLYSYPTYNPYLLPPSYNPPPQYNPPSSNSPIIIQNSGSTNTDPYGVTVNSDGSGFLSVNNSVTKQFSSGTFNYGSLLSAIEAVPTLSFQGSCMKSASFGTTLTVEYNGQTSGDLSCPNSSYQNLASIVQSILGQACSGINCQLSRFLLR